MLPLRSILFLFCVSYVAKAFSIYQLVPLQSKVQTWKDTGHFHEYEHYQIFYRDLKGTNRNKEVLLALNGFPTSSFEYYKILPHLSTIFHRTIAPDFLGMGFSSKPRDIDYHIDYQSEIIEDLVYRFLNISSVHILCHDYGVVVAQDLLLRFKERQNHHKKGLDIKSIVFLNGAIYPNAETLILPQQLMTHFLTQPFAKYLVLYPLFRISFRLLFHISPTEKDLEAFYSILAYNEGPLVTFKILKYHEEQHSKGHRWVLATREAKIPLSIVIGIQDNTLHSKSAFEAECKHLYPQAKVYMVPGAGHFPHFEKPEFVADILDDIWGSLLQN